MKQSSKRKIYSEVAFLYERLSRDDDLEGESNSIANQKKLLTKAAKEKGYTKVVHFFDDGVSGVTMDRPQFNEMLEQLRLGKGGAVFVKDLSRLRRNYIEVGRLTEEFFRNTVSDWSPYPMGSTPLKAKANLRRSKTCLTSGTPGTSAKSAA